MPTIRPASNAAVAKAALTKVSTGAPFKTPVHLTGPQLKAYGNRLSALAKTDPQRAAVLLQRTLDLYGSGKVKVDINAPISYAARNSMAEMVNTVSAAIHKADPSVVTPAPMMLAR